MQKFGDGWNKQLMMRLEDGIGLGYSAPTPARVKTRRIAGSVQRDDQKGGVLVLNISGGRLITRYTCMQAEIALQPYCVEANALRGIGERGEKKARGDDRSSRSQVLWPRRLPIRTQALKQFVLNESLGEDRDDPNLDQLSQLTTEFEARRGDRVNGKSSRSRVRSAGSIQGLLPSVFTARGLNFTPLRNLILCLLSSFQEAPVGFSRFIPPCMVLQRHVLPF